MSNPNMYGDGTLDKSAYRRKPKGSDTDPFPRAKRGKRPKAVSEAQKRRTAFLHGVKAERIRGAIEEHSEAFCAVGHCLIGADTFEEAWQLLDLHHTVKRSQGHGYRDASDFGLDSPELLTLVCRTHHRELEHSEPMFRHTPDIELTGTE